MVPVQNAMAIGLALLAIASFPGGSGPADAAASEPFRCPLTGAVPLIELEPELAVPAHLPAIDECAGLIRPGARQSNGCTLNFVFRDPDDLYIGTAGHCTSSIGQRIGTPGIGQFGSVVFRMNAGVGHDFALILIDADKHDLVNPRMCAWGGPSAEALVSPPGQHVHNYGWGFQTNDNAETRARPGVLANEGASSVAVLGFGSPGDSGSPVTGMFDQPVGIVTHGLTAEGSPVIYGTSYARMLSLAHGAGLQVELVPGTPGGLP